MFRRRHAIVLLASMPALIALGGCKDDEKATPQIIFEGAIELGESEPGYNSCRDSGDLFTIGDFGNPDLEPPKASNPIKDGQAWDQGVVSVSCSVKSVGTDEFDVVGSIALSGATGGFFRIDGRFKSSGEQTNIHASFNSRRSTNAYDEVDRGCIVRYGTSFQGVASGRVWGEIDCPKAKNESAQTICRAKAQFRFENCDQ